MNKEEKYILRYNKNQIFIHWTFVGSFFVLLITGLFMVIPSMAVTAGVVSSSIHKIAAVIFVGSVVAYYVIEKKGLKLLIKESFYFDKDDIEWLKKMPFYFFGKSKNMPPSGRWNAGEKLHHIVKAFTFLTVSISGFFMWFGTGILSPNLFVFMVLVHNISMIAMVCFTVGHVYFTFLYGALPHMTTGYTTETYAQKHSKWLKQLKEKGMV